MKTLRNLFIAATLCAVLAAPALIAEEETAKKSAEAKVNKYFGQLSCAMCALKKTDSCQAALTQEVAGKQGKIVKHVTLLTNNETAKDFHSNICSGDQVNVTVTGLIAVSGDAKQIAASKIQKSKSELTGQLSCAMCALKKTDSCQAALTVSRTKADGKSTELTLLLLNNQTAKDFHKNICSGDQVSVTVKGYVSGKTGKKALVASEITKSAK